MVNIPNGKTVGETIVEYLEQLPVDELTDRDVWPFDATQDGIAQALGKSRAHVALEIKRLKGRGLVDEARCHVKGVGARRKVYRISASLQVYEPGGTPMPMTKGELRTIHVVQFRCPRCGSAANVALET